MQAVKCHLAAVRPYIGAHAEHNGRAVHKRRAAPQGHQGIHIGSPVQETLKSADKELLVYHHNKPGKQELIQPNRPRVGRKGLGNIPPPHQMPHRYIHKRKQKTQRRNQPAPYLRRLLVLQGSAHTFRMVVSVIFFPSCAISCCRHCVTDCLRGCRSVILHSHIVHH